MRLWWLTCLWLTLAWTAWAAPPPWLLVPLDDRPCNLLFVRQLARIAAQELNTPPRHLLGRAYRAADPDQVAAWVDRQAAAPLFISSDMLCYGGLIASRTGAVDEATALTRLEALRRWHGRGRPVRVLATLTRLSLRTSDRQAPYEAKLAQWATRPGAEPPAGVPPEVVEEYLGVRRRNLNVLLRLVEMTGEGVIDQLIIGQDDSHPEGLHRAEQQQLLEAAQAHRTGSRVRLMSGADELSMDMVAGAMLHGHHLHPKVRLIYSDPEAADRVPPMESLPLRQMVADHLELVGLEVVEHGEAVEVWIQTPLAKPFVIPSEEQKEPARAFVARVAESMAAHHQVALADLALINRMDPFLAQAVIDTIPLERLRGFAAWNTPANTFGTVAAQVGVACLADRLGRTWTLSEQLESAKTQVAFLLARLIDDYGYQTRLRTDLAPQAKGLPIDPDPLLNVYGPLGMEARVGLIAWAQELFARHFSGRTVALPGSDRRARLDRMDLEVVLPWPRTFEIEARLDLRLTPEPYASPKGKPI